MKHEFPEGSKEWKRRLYKMDKSKTIEFNPNSDMMATRVIRTVMGFNRAKSDDIIDPAIKSIMLSAKELVKPDGVKLTTFFAKKEVDKSVTIASPQKSSPVKSPRKMSPAKSPSKLASPLARLFKKRKSDESNPPAKVARFDYPTIEPFDVAILDEEMGEEEKLKKYIKLKCIICPYCNESITLVDFKNHVNEHGFQDEEDQ